MNDNRMPRGTGAPVDAAPNPLLAERTAISKKPEAIQTLNAFRP